MDKSETKSQPDWILLGTTVALIALGLMVLYSSTSDIGYRIFDDAALFFRRQLRSLGIGLVAMYIATRLPYRLWMKLSIPVMGLALFLLAYLAIFKEGRLLIGESVSPVELAKLAVVIYISHWLSSKGELLS